jgi:hypothetical protein
MHTPNTPSSSARAVLTAAAGREDHCAFAPDLPAAAQRAVLRSLLQRRLLEGTEGDLRISPAGFAAVGYTLPPTARGSRPCLRDAAQAAVAAWEAGAGLNEALVVLQAALCTSRTSQAGTKRAQVLALLRQSEGASGPQIAEATDWAPHTVRGFLAGLQRKGSKLEVLQRVRQVGPGKAGARGNYSIYRLAEEA